MRKSPWQALERIAPGLNLTSARGEDASARPTVSYQAAADGLTPIPASATLPCVDTDSDSILLEGMTFYGYHGARPEERSLGQRFVVDLEVGADLAPAGASDDLSRTINYSELYQETRAILEGEPLNLLEAVAERVAAAALAHEGALWVRVRVSKPGVAIEGSVLSAAAVEIARRAGEGGGG